MDLDLPKYPQMIVTGVPVGPARAKNIIMRTDAFFTNASEYSGGNNEEFGDSYRKQAGLLSKECALRARKAIGFIPTQYTTNDWGASTYAHGPHGWCSPYGDIRFQDNVPIKYPKAEDILEEWQRIAEAFSYLDLNVTLMSGTWDEKDTKPVFNIRVVEGEAEIIGPDLSVHAGRLIPRPIHNTEETLDHFSRWSEQGLPMPMYDDIARIVSKHALGNAVPSLFELA